MIRVARDALRRRISAWICAAACVAPCAYAQRGITLDDLFRLQTISSTALSPDGEWIAATILRPAGPGEVYGRTFYEMDVTRADVWLISRSTGERRNLTNGARNAAGFWCATWSPDGRRLAMLSTQPEAGEPRGGDNVRLYVWDRQSGRTRRMSDRAMMTQTMGGSPLYKVDLRGRPGLAGGSGRCSREENAPFLWLDDTSLLAVVLPEGEVSGLIDAYSHAAKHAGKTAERLRLGREPTATVSESGVPTPLTWTASLQRVDAVHARTRQIASVPIHPFEGDLQLALSPDGRSAAILAVQRAIPHANHEKFAFPYSSWTVDKQLGFVDLTPDSTVRWVTERPKEARYILDLLSWAPDGAAVAVRARPKPTQLAQSLFIASALDLSMVRVSPEKLSVTASAASADLPGSTTAVWLDSGRLVARAVEVSDELSPYEWYVRDFRGEALPRTDWWIFSRDARPVNLTAELKQGPASLSPASGGRWMGIADDAVWMLDGRSAAFTRLESQALPQDAQVVWPHAQDAAAGSISEFIITGRSVDDTRPLMRAVLEGASLKLTPLPAPSRTARLESYVPERSTALFLDSAPAGTWLWATDSAGGGARKLLSLNSHFADIAWGETRLIDYRTNEGASVKGGVILPPGYQPGRRYPTLLWVYAGATVRSEENAFFDRYAPGMYNMWQYAARGYVMLMPSMPLQPDGGKNDDYIELPKGVMPAVDRLIDLGIADPDRLAVMGQSYGGFSTYALVTYTNRFKAAIAMAGITDLVSTYGQFDPTARGYPGIEHQKSVNWGLAELGQSGMGVPPWEDLWHYLRNSPLYFVDRVQTPLLLIHGEQDIRGQMPQAEEFFYALYRQGKRARLLRYWGEDHGLRQSPANVRDVVDEIFDWLRINLPEPRAAGANTAP